MATAARAESRSLADPVYQAYQILHIGFTVAPILFGLDKFFNFMVDWEKYVAPWVVRIVGNGLRKDCKNKVDFEAIWVMAAKAGYALAFEELVDRNESRIYRLALNVTQNQKDAEDLLLDTFIKAHEHLHEFRSGSCFSTWLMHICISEALQNCGERHLSEGALDGPRRSGDDLMLNEMADWGDCPEKRYTETQVNQILSEAISNLSIIHRVVFLLRDVETLSTVEIADLLGLSVAGTRSCLLRAPLEVRGYLNRYFNQGVCGDSKYVDSAEESREKNVRTMAMTAT
jgi:RNA polymerase sigma-70 factor, ECF subfamily